MLDQIDSYDWEEAFKYAAKPEASIVNKKYDLSGFTREDVVSISGIIEGVNDEESWVIFGQLKDGRWFFLTAWCDYTGWG